MAIIPALIGAGASLLGGAISNRSARNQVASQTAAQREFAQHGVRWKVADAKAAGVHPLFALGGSTSTYSPVTMTDSMGPALSNAGQDLSRAVQATSTASERDELGGFITQQLAAQVARDRAAEEFGWRKAEHEMRMQLLGSQLARNAQQNNPPFPESGYVTQPAQITASTTRNPGITAGVAPGGSRFSIGGQVVESPSAEWTQANEDLFPTLLYHGTRIWNEFGNAQRDKMARNARSKGFPPPTPLPPGWKWVRVGGSWNAVGPGWSPRVPRGGR